MDDLQEAEALEAELDALGDSPTTAQILDVLKKGYRDAGVAAALKRTGGGGAPPIQVASVVLDNAQIKALPSDPVIVIPAPAATEMIVVMSGLIVVDATAGAYTNVSGVAGTGTASFSFCYGDDDAQASAYTNNGALTTTATRRAYVIPSPDSNVVGAQLQMGTALNQFGADVRFLSYNSLGNYTGGNAANTLRVTVWYAIVETVA